uniref:Taste receptor type 2 member 40 n=1 Tax=Pyxicephalus adspersus TaxID=30357 RepID=A0AAV3ARG5_PYXAD|nr:TPA: hypothetical protein GDO54_009824 [Pyxicephalus adspersus]
MLAECFAGIIVNSFIVAVQLVRWKVVKSLEICHQILTCLGVSRICCQLQSLIFFLFGLYCPWLVQGYVFLAAAVTMAMFFHLTHLWITSVLCVFYCVKITTYSHKKFIFLKSGVSGLIPWVMVASLLMSLLFSLPAGWCSYKTQHRLP